MSEELILEISEDFIHNQVVSSLAGPLSSPLTDFLASAGNGDSDRAVEGLEDLGTCFILAYCVHAASPSWFIPRVHVLHSFDFADPVNLVQ